MLGCKSQVRAVESGVYGLDFAAVLTIANLTGVDVRFLADILPAIEPFVVTAWRREES